LHEDVELNHGANNRTLQELLAPNEVQFFDAEWHSLGAKSHPSTAKSISHATGIPQDVLYKPSSMFQKSIAQRMSWASKREATRSEDVAYSLLGIFKINMPMQYGEGTLAFNRLQKEILKSSNDQSLFAWGYNNRSCDEFLTVVNSYYEHTSTGIRFYESLEYGMFAPHPSYFGTCGNIRFSLAHTSNTPITESNGAIHMSMPLVALPNTSGSKTQQYIGLLPCLDAENPVWMMGILLETLTTTNGFKRRTLGLSNCTFRIKCRMAVLAETRDIWIDHSRRHRILPVLINFTTRRSISVHCDTAVETLYLANSSHIHNWNAEEMTMHLHRTNRNFEVVALSFDAISTERTPTLSFEVHIFVATTSPSAYSSKIVFSIVEDEFKKKQKMDSFHWATDKAEVVLRSPTHPLARIKAAVESRQIYNHNMITLNISIQRS
jgi:hypothetical protein